MESIQENGNAKRVPAIIVAWDAETQQVGLQFNGGPQGDFRTWDFTVAVLKMAVAKAEFMQRMQQMQQVQQDAVEAQQNAALLKQLGKR